MQYAMQHYHACELGLKGTGMFSESLYTLFTKLLAFRYLPCHPTLATLITQHLLMAQTTLNTLFGPVILVSTFPLGYLILFV